MSIVVLKFGGTSLRNLNKDSQILKHIKKSIEKGETPVLVVSAIGRDKDPYATDTLIKQLEQINPKIDPKKKDLIMSCGETISTAIVSHLLESNNISSEPLTGFQAGILTDDNFNSAEILDIDVSTIKEYIKEGKIVVVAGFQGITEKKEITTLGRGGSDITAIALGGYLNAKRVDIFTDVPGVALIDPKLVPYTKYIRSISYDNMYKLASRGAKVIHPKSVLYAKKFNMPVRVTSTFLDVEGTLISNKDEQEEIIGIAVEKKEDILIFSIIYDGECMETITNKINRFIRENSHTLLDIKFSQEIIAIKTNTPNAEDFAQKLYDSLIE
jgi:aspartate kinase